MRSRLGVGILLLSLAIAAACGSSRGGSALDRNKTASTLTPAEQAELCDEVNGAQGGYGRSVTCTDGSTQTTDPSQAVCIQSIPTAGDPCANLTVGNLLDCANAVGSNLCTFPTTAACQPIHACSGA